MRSVRVVLKLYEESNAFELFYPETVSDFAVLRSIIGGQGLHVDPIDLPPMTMDGPFLSFIGEQSKVRYAVTTSSFRRDDSPVNPEAIASHNKFSSLQSNALVLFVVGNRAFSEKYEAQGHADEQVDLHDDCPYCHRPYLCDE
jgi:hypothetical protein